MVVPGLIMFQNKNKGTYWYLLLSLGGPYWMAVAGCGNWRRMGGEPWAYSQMNDTLTITMLRSEPIPVEHDSNGWSRYHRWTPPHPAYNNSFGQNPGNSSMSEL